VQPTTNGMDDDQPGSAQSVFGSVEERFESVQDEVKLLKAEIKQTLIDLREFMMKGQAISTTSVFDGPEAISSNGYVAGPEDQNNPSPQESPAALPDPAPAPALRYPETAPQNALGDTQGRYPMDTVKMGHIIGWLGTVANRGLLPQQLKPFLQTYEQSGHLTPAMAMLTYKSLEDMSGVQGGQSNQSYSASEYAQCLLELHEIICNPGYAPFDDTPVPLARREASPIQEPVSVPGPEVQVEAPRAQEVKPRKKAKKATGNGSKRNQAEADPKPVTLSVKPPEEAEWYPQGEHGHNG